MARDGRGRRRGRRRGRTFPHISPPCPSPRPATISLGEEERETKWRRTHLHREAVAVIKGAKKKKGEGTDRRVHERNSALPRETVSGGRESWAQAKGPVVSSGYKRRKGGRGVGKFVHPPISSSTPSLFLLRRSSCIPRPFFPYLPLTA